MSKIAILIDAENIDPSYAEQVFTFANSRGDVMVREIFGAGIALNEWVEPIMEYFLNPHITLKPNKYKNSSDISLVLGVTDILVNNVKYPETAVDTVILVSSDSDFSPVAARLRREGLCVIGMGEAGHVNPVWPKACTEFVAMEPQVPLIRKTNYPVFEAARTIPLKLVKNEAADDEESSPSESEEQPASAPEEPIAVQQDRSSDTPMSVTFYRAATHVAPTHQMRVENIRDFIREKIAAAGGRIKSAELIRELSFLADYRFDQRRSNRSPIDYLKTLYYAWFNIDPGETKNSYWISNYDPSQPRVWHSVPEDQPEPQTTPQEEPEQPQAVEEVPSQAEPEQPEPLEQPEPPEQPTPQPVPNEPEPQPTPQAEPEPPQTVEEVPLQAEDGEDAKDEDKDDDAEEDLPATSILKAGLPRKTARELRELGFKTLEDFLNTTKDDIYKINGLTGKKRKRLLRLQNTIKTKAASEAFVQDIIDEVLADEEGETLPESESASETVVVLEETVAESEEAADVSEETSSVSEETSAVSEQPEIELTAREIPSDTALSHLPPLESPLEKGGVPHRAALTLHKFGVRSIGDFLNLTDEAVADFGGVSAQRRERILRLRDEMREKYLVETASDNIPESAENADGSAVSDEGGISEGDIALFKFITEHDVPAVPATRILSIVRNSPNGRILFNGLQKAFGNKNASEYMRVLRDWKNASTPKE